MSIFPCWLRCIFRHFIEFAHFPHKNCLLQRNSGRFPSHISGRFSRKSPFFPALFSPVPQSRVPLRKQPSLSEGTQNSYNLEIAMPSRIIPTPATFRRLGRSRRMRNPNRNTQIKLVAVIQGSTVMAPAAGRSGCRTWTERAVRRRPPPAG